MIHSHKDEIIKEVEKKILKIIKGDKDKSISFEILEVSLGKSCTPKTLRQALRNLVEKGKIIESGRCFPNKPIYNLK